MFLLALFLIKNESILKSAVSLAKNGGEGLIYNTTTIGTLVEKDTDGDTIPDWQEPLYGLDPTTKETVPGIPDITAINKLRAEEGNSELGMGTDGQDTENLTQTEKFSREFFSTVASLNQNGVMDQSMADQISNSLAEKIENPAIRKVFLFSDIETTNDDSLKAVKNYKDAMLAIQKKYPDKGNVFDVLQRFVVDEYNATVDPSVLTELDPIIQQTQNALDAIVKVRVPQSLALLHLDFINAGERLIENESDMRLFDADPIVSMGAMSKYGENINSFQSALATLMGAVNKRLNG